MIINEIIKSKKRLTHVEKNIIISFKWIDDEKKSI